MRKLLVTCVISLSALFVPLASQAHAQVVINGHLFTGQDLTELEYLIGSPIPPGFYWLDTYTGDWGYEGDPAIQGNLFYGQGGGSYSGSNGGSSNESYYESSGGGYTSYTSDGECAYFSSEYGSISTCD